ncbi:MAG TPA: alkaline phosphatase family protein [Solirubrobacteraceae bacterium]|jgi:phospholipase C|nr:alkaline phosphatase family protein [Solirubrobacteraceae bacterium]
MISKSAGVGRRARRLAAVGILSGAALLAGAANAAAALPPIKHVFVLIDENESEATTFAAGSPAVYLKSLVAQGAFVPSYYGIGHSSLDNYIAMVSGQAANPLTSADCSTFAEFTSPSIDPSTGQETGQGCIYPANVPSLMSQFDTAGLTWRTYQDSMGVDPVRDGGTTCAHPAPNAADPTIAGATPTDQYATRHNPFVYFHYVIDNVPECNANVVPLVPNLQNDLASAATTPNYTFITPSTCNDAHDTPCVNGQPGGLTQADTFLQQWVPIITSSPAYKANGLLIITFDEAAPSDTTACCGETTSGGGLVGAVLLSPYITPGTVTQTPYNHYSMLGSVEDLFGLPRLAAAKGTTAFGSDVFTAFNFSPSPPPPLPVGPQDSALKLKPASFKPQPAGKARKGRGTTISYSDTQAATTKLTVVHEGPAYRVGKGACRLLSPGHKRPKHSKACTAGKSVGSFSHVDKAGANKITFTGRLGGHALGAGTYLLEATPKLGLLTGKTVTSTFRVR